MFTQILEVIGGYGLGANKAAFYDFYGTLLSCNLVINMRTTRATIARC